MTARVFDFFAGCGGASCGFRNAGLDVVFALDHDPDSCRTYRTNLPSVHLQVADIRTVSARRILTLARQHRPHPLVFSGCAPCQPFTKQNTTRPSPATDARVQLLPHFARFVHACRPDVVFIENVPGLQRFSHAFQPLSQLLTSLHQARYHVTCRPVPLMKYGVPQQRRRLVLLASRRGPIDLPPETHGPGTANPHYETVRAWIADLPPLAAGEEHPTCPNHRASGLSLRNLARVRATPEGGSHRNWPPDLQLPCHRRTAGYIDVYGRMSWDRPASALTTRCISYSNGRFGHPEQDRAISVREAACLQTFPRNYLFTGSLASMARQIGNAVPVRFATLVGQHILHHLSAFQGPSA